MKENLENREELQDMNLEKWDKYKHLRSVQFETDSFIQRRRTYGEAHPIHIVFDNGRIIQVAVKELIANKLENKVVFDLVDPRLPMAFMDLYPFNPRRYEGQEALQLLNDVHERFYNHMYERRVEEYYDGNSKEMDNNYHESEDQDGTTNVEET